MQLTHNLFIQMFLPIKKPTSQLLLYEVGYRLWTQLDLNQRSPNYKIGATSQLSFKLNIQRPTNLFQNSLNYASFEHKKSTQFA